MTAPMTPERLAEIRANDEAAVFPHVTTAAVDRRELLAEVDRLRAALPIICACGRSAEWHDANPGAQVEPINAGPACEHGVCAGSGWYGSRWHNPDNYSPHLHCRCGAECGACASGDGFKRSGPSEPERTEVVDLVAALRASVEAARKRRLAAGHE